MLRKRILITGGGGFIGHHLVDFVLRATDWDVVVLDRLDHAGNLERLMQLGSFVRERARVRVAFHDLRAAINNGALRQLGGSFEYTAHLAAGSHVDRSVQDPTGFVLDNVLGTANLLDWARHNSERTLVFSTDECLGAAEEGQLFTEGDRFNPTNPYAATKAGGELLAPAYSNTYGMNIVVTRAGNVMGERQDPEKFVPLATRKIAREQVVQIHTRRIVERVSGTGDDPIYGHRFVESSRLYTHVENVCSAVLAILERGERIRHDSASVGRYNISGGEDRSNLSVAAQIAELVGKPLRYEFVEDPPGRPRPDMRYGIDASKLRRELGWEPHVSFEEGLRRTVAAELEEITR